ncbi:MAG: glycine betaine ABC transporter substrate-binding protein [Streptomyces sp.]|uniref:glycine betaine ABC transporter substrate-binding protein n=1 Tax=Streptomyces sp. TaxID=1931 RepID=UPI003D6BB697
MRTRTPRRGHALARTARTAPDARTARTHPLAAGAVVLALVGTLSGCGLVSGSPVSDKIRPGTVGKGQPLAGAKLTVTSKEFTEQLILGRIMALVFRAAGADVVDRTGIQGSIGAREAVKSGAADGMYEYTGTGWITYLGHVKPVPDPKEQWRVVRDADRDNGITWLAPSALDNTYVLAINDKLKKKYGLRSLSDVAELSRKTPGAATLCLDSEFAARDDGLNGMAKKYGMKVPAGNVHKMAAGVIYEQADKGTPCMLGEVTSTDGRIQALGLNVLEDDKKFFPNYNAAPAMNSATMKKYPQIEKLLAPITKALDNDMARGLNAKVDVEGQDPHDVAKDWLLRKGFIKTG